MSQGQNPFVPKQISSYPSSLSKALSQPSPVPHPNTDLTSMLDAFLHTKVTKERQYFLNQHINLDGQRFIECRFDGCSLYTQTGDIYLKDCVFGINNTVFFGETLKKVVQLASMLNPQLIPSTLLAEVKQKGAVQTVSIT